jgi:hypothetical protein
MAMYYAYSLGGERDVEHDIDGSTVTRRRA